jgi:hypothetical protein
MTLIMRDSIDPFAIPLDNLAAVAGYGDGTYQWPSEGWARFPASVVPLSIVVHASNAGDILDVESGAASPQDCPGWADNFDRPRRRRPTIYCNRQTIAEVRMWMGARPFDWWAATLDGIADLPGAVAVQYAGEAQTGGHYDESVILDPDWIGGDMSLAPDERDALFGIAAQVGPDYQRLAPTGIAGTLLRVQAAQGDQLAAIEKAIASGQLPPADIKPLLDALALQRDMLAGIKGTLDRIEAALKNA